MPRNLPLLIQFTDKQQLFQKDIKPGVVIYDIGANAGLYTLLSSILKGNSGKVFAFEPVPKNIFYIKQHIVLNKIDNTVLIDKAVPDRIAKLKFSLSANPSMGHLSEDGEIEVETINLDAFVKQGNPPPDLIKMDIEGAEFDALNGAREIFKTNKPIIFLATHGDEVKKKCLEWLKVLNYKIEIIGNGSLAEADEFVCVSLFDRDQ